MSLLYPPLKIPHLITYIFPSQLSYRPHRFRRFSNTHFFSPFLTSRSENAMDNGDQSFEEFFASEDWRLFAELDDW